MSTFDFDVIGDPLPPKRIVPAERVETPQAKRQDPHASQTPAFSPAGRNKNAERRSP